MKKIKRWLMQISLVIGISLIYSWSMDFTALGGALGMIIALLFLIYLELPWTLGMKYE